MLHGLTIWLLHITGSDDVSGPWYGFWSGFGSDLGEFAIISVVFRRLNCHAKGCYRIGTHHVQGTPYVTCRKHHPILSKKASAKEISDRHKEMANA